jgi:hypothetical protein
VSFVLLPAIVSAAMTGGHGCSRNSHAMWPGTLAMRG